MRYVKACSHYVARVKNADEVSVKPPLPTQEVQFSVRYGHDLVSLRIKHCLVITRRTSGHCLGTFQTAKLCFDYTSLQNGSVSHYPPPQLSSLSLSLSP
jgi:hypothetical protein